MVSCQLSVGVGTVHLSLLGNRLLVQMFVADGNKSWCAENAEWLARHCLQTRKHTYYYDKGDGACDSANDDGWHRAPRDLKEKA